ncbi:MAG: hypothetical protein LBP27_04510 [Treponema sp.]|jgi:hypothetical protein|nr:hypothetical protein [Treponema sp.]
MMNRNIFPNRGSAGGFFTPGERRPGRHAACSRAGLVRGLTAFFCLFAVFLPGRLGAQNSGSGRPAPGAESVIRLDGEPAPPAGEKAELPRRFRELSLGMNLDALKNSLKGDGLFSFRGDRDVSFLPFREQSLVETTGSSFIRRAFFQLRDDVLFIMAFSLDTGLVDHYSIFTSFVEKYGEPLYLDPGQAVWENEDTRLAIERPLTVKYIDRKIFNEIIDESSLMESRELRRRQEFLDEF